MTANKTNIYTTITQQLIEKLKAGELVWNQGFQTKAAQNWVSKKTYSGINSILLNFLYAETACPYYASFQQIRQLGGTVKKGTKGKRIIYYSIFYVQKGKKSIQEKAYQQLSEQEQSKWIKRSIARQYYLFNMLDTENCQDFDYDKWDKNITIYNAPSDQSILTAYQALVDQYQRPPNFQVHLNKNAYQPDTDTIYYIAPNRWDQLSDYVATMLHEIVHSTGHTSRLNRSGVVQPIQFGSKNYAEEEFVAELGAAFLCHDLGILPKAIDNTAAYLQYWIAVLEQDDRLLFRAAAQAQKAVNYIYQRE